MDLISSILFISTIGTLLHFSYDFSKHNKLVGLFSAVNESTWEHIKMALTPTFIWMIYDYFKYGSNPNFCSAELISILSIMILTPFIFYSYKSILKRNMLLIDISVFYIAIIISQLLKDFLLNVNFLGNVVNCISCILLFILFVFYLLATIKPIKNFIFKDPLTNKYGFKGHKK